LLQQFPVQCIKIDRAFVQNITSDPATQTMVRTIIAMAESMGADVVAEGIESPQQLAALRSLECHRAQGYLISRPVSSDDVPDTVRSLHDVDAWRERIGY
jgi:EAL domain-containing protein (putative c-di-GMP-specific phosphodiesterase class I)